MGENQLTANQIVQIYWLKKEGKTGRRIAEDLGISKVGRVQFAMRGIEKYLDPKQLHAKKSKRKTYVRAARQIEEEIARRQEIAQYAVNRFAQAVEEPQKVEVVEETKCLQNQEKDCPDRFDKLEQSLSVFQEAVSQFIEEEVRSQVCEVLEYTELLKEELKKTKQELEPLREEAHKSNWIGSLRQKFGNVKFL